MRRTRAGAHALPRRRILVRGLVGLVAGGGLVACSAVLGLDATHLRDTAGDAADAASIDSGAATPPLVATPSAVVLRRGAAIDVRVALAEPSDASALRVEVTGLPEGVTASELLLDSSTHAGTLHLVASAAAKLGRASPVLTAEDGMAGTPLALLVSDAAGSLDVTFDGDGRVELGGTGTVQALAIDDEEGVVAAGLRASGGWLLTRLDESGALDGAFASALPALPDTGEVTALVRSSDGRLLVAGWTTADAGAETITVARLLATGAADPAFGDSGFTRIAVAGPHGARARGITALGDGTLLVVGTRDADGVLLRLHEDGSLDPAFGTRIVPATALVGAVAGEGSFVAGGTETTGAAPMLRLERRLLDGGVDPSFGTGGFLRFGTTYEAEALASWGTDLALVGGTVAFDGGGAYVLGVATSAGVERFARGVATGTGARFHGAAASLGALVAAGNGTGAGAEARVARVLPDAGLDPAYGAAGFARLDPADAGSARDLALSAVVAHRDGRVVVGGKGADGRPVLVRLWP